MHLTNIYWSLYVPNSSLAHCFQAAFSVKRKTDLKKGAVIETMLRAEEPEKGGQVAQSQEPEFIVSNIGVGSERGVLSEEQHFGATDNAIKASLM